MHRLEQVGMRLTFFLDIWNWFDAITASRQALIYAPSSLLPLPFC